MSLGTIQGTVASVAWGLVLPLCSYCMQVNGPEFLLQLDTIFQHISLLQISAMIHCIMLS